MKTQKKEAKQTKAKEQNEKNKRDWNERTHIKRRADFFFACEWPNDLLIIFWFRVSVERATAL